MFADKKVEKKKELIVLFLPLGCINKMAK